MSLGTDENINERKQEKHIPAPYTWIHFSDFFLLESFTSLDLSHLFEWNNGRNLSFVFIYLLLNC